MAGCGVIAPLKDGAPTTDIEYIPIVEYIPIDEEPVEAEPCATCVEGYTEVCDEWKNITELKVVDDYWDLNCCIKTFKDSKGWTTCYSDCLNDENNLDYLEPEEVNLFCEDMCDYRADRFCHMQEPSNPLLVKRMKENNCLLTLDVVEETHEECIRYKLVRDGYVS